MTSLKERFNLIIISIIIFFVCNKTAFAAGELFGLYTNDNQAMSSGVAFDFYPSGYSDGWYWGVSNRHLHWACRLH